MTVEPIRQQPAATEFSPAEHAMLDAMNVAADRAGRALLFREMQRTGLDPFAKHIYLREDWNEKKKRNTYSAASTIDGFRIVAQRQSTYEGQTAPQWCDKDGKWSEVWVADAPPVAARIGVYVKGYREPMWGIARFGEYRPSGNAGFMWGKMASHMVAKVAEALAIRKAYPDQLSGIYTDDEMQQADSRDQDAGETRRPAQAANRAPAADDWSTSAQPPAAAPPPARPEQINSIVGGLTAVRGVKDRDAARTAISFIIGREIGSAKDLTAVEADQVLAVLRAESEQKPQGTPAAAAGPAPIGTPNNPVASEAQQKMLNSLLNKAGCGKREKALEMVGRILRRTIDTREGLSKADASTVINALNKLLDSGEMPPPWEPLAAEPFVHPNDEGFDVFDALNQMILDVRDEETFNATQRAIEDEFARGEISETAVQTLRNRLAEHSGAMAA